MVVSRCKLLAYGQVHATATPSHPLLESRMLTYPVSAGKDVAKRVFWTY